MKLNIFVSSLVVLVCSHAAQAATLHVSTTGGGDCTSWANACSLSTALNTATAGDQVWVKQGTYSGPITLVNGVKLIGGFGGTEMAASQSNPATKVTILDGGGTGRVVYSSDHANSTVVRGFTIQNGNDSGNDGGGALYLENSGTVFVQCTFYSNVAAYFGAVMAVRGTSSPHFVNCKFSGNGTGSGTSVQPLGGGVVFLHSGTVNFSNCLFNNNKAGEAGVLMNMMGSGWFYNCTLVNNEATFGDGGAILDGDGQIRFRNSILWGNTVPAGRAGAQIKYSQGYLPSVTYCDVEGGFAGTGNINATPQFVNGGANPFDLLVSSPCKDVGNNPDLPLDVGDLDWDGDVTEVLPKDINLDSRKIQFTVDMGAYEAPLNVE